MRAARPLGARAARVRRQRGFSYLAVLFLVALTAAGLATLGQAWRTSAQRERERELEFRGGEIARAIASYQRAAAVEPAPYPASLRDLLADDRGPRVRRHLRRLYVDPFTGAADWVLVPDPLNPARFRAVHSRADIELLRRTAPDGQPIAKASDWVFDPLAAAAGPARPASAPVTPSLPGGPAAPAPGPITPAQPGPPPPVVPAGRPTPD